MAIGTMNIPMPDPISAKTSIKYRIYYARVRDEVDMEAWPKPTDATIDMIPMLPGKFMHYIDCRATSVKPNVTSVGDIAPEGELTLTADIAGLSKTVLSWLYGNNGEDMVVIWELCATGEKFVAGSPCSGLKMTFTKLGTDENFTGATLQFKGQCPDPFNYFEGNIPLEAPVSVPANATTFALAVNSGYVLPENTAATVLTAITGVTDSDVGRIIDISGNGVNFPTTIDPSSSFILQNGSPFIATAGARISFEIAKVGTSTFAFYEVARG